MSRSDPKTAKTKEDLLDNHFPDKDLYEDIYSTLINAKGMAGLIFDVASMGEYTECRHEMKPENLRSTAKQIETLIKDAIIMLDDYQLQKS